MDAIVQRALQGIAEQILAARLSEARLDGEAISPHIVNQETAYAMQDIVRRRALGASLGAAVGYKIGMSTESAQRQYGIAEPISGHVFENRLHSSPATLAAARHRRIGVECEIAVRLGADLLPVSLPYDADRVISAVESVHTAIEILEDRFTALDKASIWTLAADDMLGYGGVLGDSVTTFDSSQNRNGTIAIDGRTGISGMSGDLQGGGPMAGLAWLANRLARTGRHLKAGEVVFCGGITAPTWVDCGPDEEETLIVAEVDGVGEARLAIRWEEG